MSIKFINIILVNLRILWIDNIEGKHKNERHCDDCSYYTMNMNDMGFVLFKFEVANTNQS